MAEVASVPKISLRDVFQIVFSKKKVLIFIFILVVVVTTVFAFTASPIYQVEATVLVKPSVESTLLNAARPGTMTARPVEQADINSEIEIMKSKELLVRIVEELKLDQATGGAAGFDLRMAVRKVFVALGVSVAATPKDAAVASLKRKLSISPVTNSNTIRAAMEGEDPKFITKVVNTFLDFYIDQHILVHQAKGSLEFFTEQTHLYKKKLEKAETALKVFQKKWTIIDIESQRGANLELLKTMRETLATIRSQIAEQQSRLDTAKESLKEYGDDAALTQDLREAPALVELTRSLMPLLVERQRVGMLYPEDSIEIQDLDRQVRETKEAIRRERSQILSGNELDLKALVSYEAALVKEIDRVEAESSFLTQKEMELNELTRDVSQFEKNYLLYDDKSEEARIADAKEKKRVANVAVASWATVPSVPIFPKKGMLVALALFLGAVAGLVGAFIAYYMDHTLKTPEDLTRQTGLPVLAALGVIEPIKREGR